MHSIVWDLDGTLYPLTTMLQTAVQQRLLQAIATQLQLSLVDAEQLYTSKKKDLKSSTKVLFELGLDGHDIFIKIWDELPLSHYIPPNPLLQHYFTKASSWTHYIHTNTNTHSTVVKKLACIGLSPALFKDIVTSVELAVEKPDPTAFEKLITRTKINPSQSLYVGDRVEVDLIPAKKLGFTTCLIGSAPTTEETEWVDQAHPTAVGLLATMLPV